MSHQKEGILITNSTTSFANHLRAGQSGFLPFGGKTMYSMHADPKSLWTADMVRDGNPDGLEIMCNKKGRVEEKPVVLTPGRTGTRGQVERANVFDVLVTDEAKEKIYKLLEMTPPQSSLGILCIGNPGLRQRVLHRTKKTVGVMVPGESAQYEEVIDKLDRLIVGTSSNPSGLPRSRGSGAHRLEALLVDFGNDPELCVLLARGREPRGGSSSMFEISADGTQATILRTGNLSLEAMEDMCHKVGINKIDDSQIKEIKPYDMTGFPGGETFAWGIFQYYRFLTQLKGDVNVPMWLVEQLRRRVKEQN